MAKYKCCNCPLYDKCSIAHFEVYGGVLAYSSDIDSYNECNIYIACWDSKNITECIKSLLEQHEPLL